MAEAFDYTKKLKRFDLIAATKDLHAAMMGLHTADLKLSVGHTMARLRNHVEPLLGRMRVSEITSGDIEKFAAESALARTGYPASANARGDSGSGAAAEPHPAR